MNTAVAPISSSSADPDSPSSSRSCSTTGLADMALNLIGSSSMHRYENEFRTMSDETECYLSISSRLARSTEFIAKQLENVGIGFEELSRCLELWPPGLVVNLGNETVRNSSDLSRGLGDDSGTCMQIDLAWDRDRHPAPLIVAKATKLAAKATAALAAQLRTITLPKWRDAASYAQSIQNVLDSRNNLEKRYFTSVEELKHETAALPDTPKTGRLSSVSRNYFHWRPRSLSVLVSDTDKLQDQVSYCNGQIRAEYSRWRAERSEETIQNLLQMSQIYMNCWACVASGWRSTVTELEPCCVNCPTQMDILEPISESAQTPENAELPSTPSSDKSIHEGDCLLTSDPGNSSQPKSFV
ncbi:hypothetical protein EG68_06784 [Paragonimus skrjabini miyazakii]|uniref:Uncharacterized protein n=1 Tax=Paragonimus skrjabini miyazakii TaxID=59628 RepID=A0A8S9YMP8_9TREM|nr:hypothetical protein EG68_06784 [Paragonimus skrjabini miyazakii]